MRPEDVTPKHVMKLSCVSPWFQTTCCLSTFLGQMLNLECPILNIIVQLNIIPIICTMYCSINTIWGLRFPHMRIYSVIWLLISVSQNRFAILTRTNCPYAATFLYIYSISPPIYIIYIHIYTYTNIYTYIFTCSTLKFYGNIFIEDAMPEKAL